MLSVPGYIQFRSVPGDELRGAVITGELKSKVDRVWDAFWSGGISNPLEVVEQITYLLFIRRLDDLETLAEKKAQRTGQPAELRFSRTAASPSIHRPSPDEIRAAAAALPPLLESTAAEKLDRSLRPIRRDSGQ